MKFVMKPAFTNGILSVILAVVMFVICVLVFVYGATKVYHYGTEKYKKTQNESAIDSEEPIRFGIQSSKHFGFALAGVGVLIGLVVFGFVASALLRPIFVYRYLIPALGCFWLGFAVVFNEMWEENRKNIYKLIFTAITICMLCLLDTSPSPRDRG